MLFSRDFHTLCVLIFILHAVLQGLSDFVCSCFQDVEDGFKDLISTFLWPDIGKLTFDVSVHFIYFKVLHLHADVLI